MLAKGGVKYRVMVRLPALPDRIVPRLQLRHRAEEGGRTWNVAIEEVVPECLDIEGAVKSRELNEWLDLGREQKRSGPRGEEQRLLAESIAREHEPLRLGIPEREGEHAAKSADRIKIPGPVGLDENLGVRGRAEAMAKRQELFTELDVVVDLAIEGDGKSAVLARHRLMPAANIDDREAAMAQADLETPIGGIG